MSKTCGKCVYFCKYEDKCGLLGRGIKYSDSNACEKFKGRNRIKKFFEIWGDNLFIVILGFVSFFFIAFISYMAYLEIKNPSKPYNILVVDGCEYIQFRGKKAVVHKANCKNHGKGEK